MQSLLTMLRHLSWRCLSALLLLVFPTSKSSLFFRGTIEMQMILITNTTTFAAAVIYIATGTTATTAGLPISYTVGHCDNFCCRGPILIPRPDSETSAQTTRVNVLDFFVKAKNRSSASYTKRR